MPSGRRKAKQAKQAKPPPPRPLGTAPCRPSLFAPYNSYGQPEFAIRGFYIDVPFRCVDCGKDEVWTATQQKWWYEVAKGYPYSIANRCRPCRRAQRGATPAR